MWKIAFTITAALLAKVAFAFDIPNWVQPTGQSSVSGNFQISGPSVPASCANKPAALAYLKEWRQGKRSGYATMVSKNIPALLPGTSCIKAPEAVDVKFEAAGNFFTVTCLAQTKGRLTHLYKMELLVEPQDCMSDAKLNEFVNSTMCQSKQAIDHFTNVILAQCGIGANPPKLRSGNVSYPIDPAFFANLLNQRPAILNVVDEDRRVKVGRTGSGGSTQEGEDCNAAGCFGKTNSRDVK